MAAVFVLAGGAMSRSGAASAITEQTHCGIPAFDHIVVVVEENHSYHEIIGNNSAAPYINNILVGGGALLNNYFGVSHPSEPNYLSLYAGSTFGVTDDGQHSFPDPTLDTVLNSGGKTFSGYVEGPVKPAHNPWESFPEGFSVESNFSNFPTSDFSSLPTVSFVIPNLNDDMHDGTIAQADTWLQQNIDKYAQWAVSHNSLLIVTWDEDDSSQSNHVPAIFYGAGVAHGSYATLYNHYNMPSTLLVGYGLTGPNNAAGAIPIQVFNTAKPLCCDDFNGDGKADILWRHTSGQVYEWLVTGTSISSFGSPGSPAAAWHIE